MSKPRILVVDDSRTVLRVVGTVLKAADYDVTCVPGGEEALAEARAVMPDLVLLDFRMPHMNGYQVLKALGEDDELHELPVILMCSKGDRVSRDVLETLGIVDYMTKPFAPATVATVVGHGLEKYGRRLREETSKIGRYDGLSSAGSAAGDALPSLLSEADEAPFAEAVLGQLGELLETSLSARGIDGAEDVATEVMAALAARAPEDLLVRAASHKLTGQGRAERMPALFGDLQVIPLPEVMQLLKTQGHTGVLELAIGEARFSVSFRTGTVLRIHARNSPAAFRLGRYFIATGVLSPEGLEQAMAECPPGVALGEHLLSMGRVTRDDLQAALTEQARDLMYEMLRRGGGTFGLRKSRIAEDAQFSAFLPELSVDELLLEGVRRIDEWNVIEKEVPSFSAHYRRRKSATADGLEPTEQRVFEAIPAGGAADVFELQELTAMAPFDVCKIVYRLVSLQRIVRLETLSSDTMH